MIFTDGYAGREQAIVALFAQSFADSDGPQEGQMIAELVRELLEITPTEDMRVICAMQNDTLAGGTIYTRLRYRDDARVAYLLSPVAVRTENQGMGTGQSLIRHGLTMLGADGVDTVLTYGDPAFYGKVGFAPIGQDIAADADADEHATRLAGGAPRWRRGQAPEGPRHLCCRFSKTRPVVAAQAASTPSGSFAPVM